MSAMEEFKGKRSSYVLHELIGKGGSALVYRATDKVTGETVAVKKMELKEDSTLAEWLKEVELLNTLSSKYTIEYLDHMKLDRSLLIVQEFAEGGSLLKKLREHGNGLDEKEVARLIYHVTCGLAYIHSKGIAHRDLKCANVLLCAGGAVKLSDFGLSVSTPPPRAISHATGPDTSVDEKIMGSVYWMAPETVRGERPSLRSDIWSLGSLCVELLTGKPPFFDHLPASAIYHIAELDAPPIPTMALSADCRNFIGLCFQRNPSDRPTAAALISHPWLLGVTQLRSEGAQKTEGIASPPASGLARAPSSTQSPFAQADAPKDDIGRQVESNLFAESTAEREKWLREGHLRKAVNALGSITAGESFNIIRSFSFAAQRCRTEESCFLEELGATTLWGYKELNLLCKAEDLATLYSCCCAMQEATVVQYTPTHPNALCFLLQCQEKEVVGTCVDALYTLLVGPDDSSPSCAGAEVAAPTQKDKTRKVSERQRLAAQQRLLSDNGLLALRRIIEEQCQAAFMAQTEPHLGWPLVEKLMEILWTVMPLGAEPMLLGTGLGASVPVVEEEGTTCVGGNASSSGDGLEGAVLRSDGNQRVGIGYGQGDGAARRTAAAQALGTTVIPQERWFLAIQEASRHGCPHAIQLMARFVRFAAQNNLQHLTVAGACLAGTCLVLLSDINVDASTHVLVIGSLITLQRASAKAAQLLRDPRSSIPLLSHSMQQWVDRRDECESLLRGVMSLFEDERMAVACASCGEFVFITIRIVVDFLNGVHDRGQAETLLAMHLLELLLVDIPNGAEFARDTALVDALRNAIADEQTPVDVSKLAGRLQGYLVS